MNDLLAPAAGVSAGSRAAWSVLATVPLPEGWRRDLTSNGFIQNDLRFYRGNDWMFSAVLAEGWVLFYARRPAISAGLVAPAAFLAAFPVARWKGKGEAKLRLHDEAEARDLWDWAMAGA